MELWGKRVVDSHLLVAREARVASAANKTVQRRRDAPVLPRMRVKLVMLARKLLLTSDEGSWFRTTGQRKDSNMASSHGSIDERLSVSFPLPISPPQCFTWARSPSCSPSHPHSPRSVWFGCESASA